MTMERDLDALVREVKGRTSISASILLLSIISIIIAVFIWAWLTELDDVTRASGRVVPAGDVQIVQTAEDGTVTKIFVSEGDLVDAGMPLVELDGTVQNSQLDAEINRNFALKARILRLKAEIDQKDLIFDRELEQNAAEILTSEKALFRGREAALLAEISVLELRREQRKSEQQEIRSVSNSAKRTLELVVDERKIIEPLVDNGVEPRTTLLSLQRQEEDLLGRISASEANLLTLESALAEIEETIQSVRNRFQADALAELSSAVAERSALQPKLRALENMAARSVLIAPVSGVINRLHIGTIGGVLRSGQGVAEIVPLNDDLLIEAYVRPQDIAFIRPDQPVRVKLTAYDFSRYGGLDGKIVRIGADAVQKSERDQGEVFVVIVRTNGSLFDADGDAVRIIPGMTAEIDILAGKRRIIDYLLQPIERVRDRAFKD